MNNEKRLVAALKDLRQPEVIERKAFNAEELELLHAIRNTNITVSK